MTLTSTSSLELQRAGLGGGTPALRGQALTARARRHGRAGRGLGRALRGRRQRRARLRATLLLLLRWLGRRDGVAVGGGAAGRLCHRSTAVSWWQACP